MVKSLLCTKLFPYSVLFPPGIMVLLTCPMPNNRSYAWHNKFHSNRITFHSCSNKRPLSSLQTTTGKTHTFQASMGKAKYENNCLPPEMRSKLCSARPYTTSRSPSLIFDCIGWYLPCIYSDMKFAPKLLNKSYDDLCVLERRESKRRTDMKANLNPEPFLHTYVCCERLIRGPSITYSTALSNLLDYVLYFLYTPMPLSPE